METKIELKGEWILNLNSSVGQKHGSNELYYQAVSAWFVNKWATSALLGDNVWGCLQHVVLPSSRFTKTMDCFILVMYMWFIIKVNSHNSVTLVNLYINTNTGLSSAAIVVVSETITWQILYVTVNTAGSKLLCILCIRSHSHWRSALSGSCRRHFFLARVWSDLERPVYLLWCDSECMWLCRRLP